MTLLYDLSVQAMREHIVENFGAWEETEQQRIFNDSTVVSAHEILLDGQFPLGFVNVFKKEDSVHLNRLCIVPKYQARGIGTAIIQELICACKAGAFVTLQVFPRNPAINLYRRMGFKETTATSTHIHMVYSRNDSQQCAT